MTIAIALLIAVIGVVLYFVSSHAKIMEIGRIMFGCGLLAFLLQSGVALHYVGLGAR